MKILFVSIILLIPVLNLNSQGIGELAPPKESIVFPPNAWGFDLMISDGGFGLGGFYRHQIADHFTLFGDISFSESKDEREFEYIDIFGNKFTIGKMNRVFVVPINFGLQYRLFAKELADNLRPYINAGVGPSLIITTPYAEEFFNAFSFAETKVAAGGYVGFGANFGLNKSSLIGLNFRYYIIKLIGEGVESLEGRKKNVIGGFFVTFNVGFMY